MALLGMIFLSTTASAQYRGNNYGNQGTQIAINNGYQLGYGQGSNDRSYGQSYNMNNKVYRDADSGSHNSGINSDQYKQLFRQGYETGYQDGFKGNGRRGYFDSGNYNNRPNGYSNQSPYYRQRNYPQSNHRGWRHDRNGNWSQWQH